MKIYFSAPQGHGRDVAAGREYICLYMKIYFPAHGRDVAADGDMYIGTYSYMYIGTYSYMYIGTYSYMYIGT